MSANVMILVVLMVSAGAVWILSIFVAQGYRDALREVSTCPKCGHRRPGQFCAKCGYKKA